MAGALGCQNASSAGRRIGEDAFIVGTSPLQIPTMAVRDAATNFDDPVVSAFAFPLTFPLFLLEHTLLTTAHAADLVVFPAHFFHDSESLGFYEPYGLPLERRLGSEAFSQRVGEVALVALVVGLPIAIAVFSATSGNTLF